MNCNISLHYQYNQYFGGKLLIWFAYIIQARSMMWKHFERYVRIKKKIKLVFSLKSYDFSLKNLILEMT